MGRRLVKRVDRRRGERIAGPGAQVCGCGDDASAAYGGNGERCEFCLWWDETHPSEADG